MSADVVLIAPPLTWEAAYPLRLASLAAALKARGARTLGLDLRRDPGTLSRWLATSDAAAPALVVVESSIRNLAQVRAVVERVRARTAAQVVVTGTAAAVAPAAFMGAPGEPWCADTAVTGDAEVVVPALLDAATDRYSAVAGAWRRTPAGDMVSSPGGFLPLDELPLADRELFPLEEYCRHPLRGVARHAPIEASRGCTLGCSFCPVPRSTAHELRLRPVDGVIDEMDQLRHDHDVTHFLLEDEQPLLDRGWFSSLLAAVRGRLAGAVLELPNGVRPDLLDPELLEEMARSGVARIALGIESGSDRVRRAIGRPIEPARLLGVIDDARRRGLVVAGYFMVGLPGESAVELAQTLSLARRLPVHYVHLSVCWPWSPLLLEPNRATRLGTALRAAGYLGAYSNPRRALDLCRIGDLSLAHGPIAVGRLGRWIASGARGGGGW